MEVYPILLKPAYQHYLWGGRHLASRYGRDIGEEICAESWEISDRPEGMGVIENGVYKGMSLSELIDKEGKALVGVECEDFPVLIKLIDAAQPLSVQVHPDEEAAERMSAEPKTEMWNVLFAEEGALLYVGLKKGTSQEEFEKALDEGSVQELLQKHPVKQGDCFLIPAGTLHAIGQGCLIYEVQQNSNTTYRVWDWNRVDVNGKPRQLHRKQALECIHYDYESLPARKESIVRKENGHYDRLITNPRFIIEKLNFSGSWVLEKEVDTYLTLFVMKGECQVEVGSGVERLKCGQSCLIPAVAEEVKLLADDGARLILTKRGSCESP